jgi:hypothetical protein
MRWAQVRGAPSTAELGRLGVARVSVGPAIAQAALAATRRAAREVLERGTGVPMNAWNLRCRSARRTGCSGAPGPDDRGPSPLKPGVARSPGAAVEATRPRLEVLAKLVLPRVK